MPEYFQKLAELLKRIDAEALTELLGVLRWTRIEGRSLYLLGNGGSAANASHAALHFNQQDLRSLDLLADQPYLSALANDYSYPSAPALRLSLEARAGDALLVFSGSGSSQNVLLALSKAQRLGLNPLGLLGFDGGEAAFLCHRFVLVPSCEYGLVEDAHSACLHWLAGELGKGR